MDKRYTLELERTLEIKRLLEELSVALRKMEDLQIKLLELHVEVEVIKDKLVLESVPAEYKKIPNRD